MAGLFCVIEGIDGSGKSTLWRGLDRALQLRPALAPLCLLREPTDLESGQRIRRHLEAGDSLPREEWLQLFLDDRRANVEQQLRPALDRGATVIQDRYYFSTAAYQGDPAQSPTAEEILAENIRQAFPPPDLILFLDISPQLASQRISQRGHARASFESLAELQRIYNNYQTILPPRTRRLDGSRPSAELIETAAEMIENLALTRRSR